MGKTWSAFHRTLGDDLSFQKDDDQKRPNLHELLTKKKVPAWQ
jgi:hypothetical protein